MSDALKLISIIVNKLKLNRTFKELSSNFVSKENAGGNMTTTTFASFIDQSRQNISGVRMIVEHKKSAEWDDTSVL